MTVQSSDHMTEADQTAETKAILAEMEILYNYFGSLVFRVQKLGEPAPGFPSRQIMDRITEASMWFRLGIDLTASRDAKIELRVKNDC